MASTSSCSSSASASSSSFLYKPDSQLDLDYLPLKIKTEDIGSRQLILSQNNFLTPITPDCDNQSLPSAHSWSFLPYSPNNSQPSSINSFSQSPCTPPSHAVDIHIMNTDSNVSYDSPHDNESSSSNFDVTPSKTWYSIGPSVAENRMPFGTGGMIPINHPKNNSPQTSNFPRPWNSSIILWNNLHNNQTNDYGDPVTSQFESSPSWESMAPLTCADSATIVPSQTVVDLPHLHHDFIPDIDLSGPKDTAVWDDVSYYSAKQVDEHQVGIEEQSSPSVHARTLSLRHQRRLRRVGSRRRTTSGSYSEGVQGELAAKLDSLQRGGIDVQMNSPAQSHVCEWDGCGRKFRRIEHLRRHREIHESTGPENICPDPTCNRSFKARADNLREHFRTHLRQSNGGRCKNPRTFEQFYGFIRNSPHISTDQGDKYIAKLELWRASKGHLKSESGSKGKGI